MHILFLSKKKQGIRWDDAQHEKAAMQRSDIIQVEGDKMIGEAKKKKKRRELVMRNIMRTEDLRKISLLIELNAEKRS